MTLAMDPEIAAALAAAAAAGRVPEPIPPGDVLALRSAIETMLGAMLARLPEAPDVRMKTFSVTAADGGTVPVRFYAREGADTQAVVIYVHGGGMVCGSAAIYDPLVRHYAQTSGVPFLAVDYRLAPEHRASGLARDVIAALRWLHSGQGPAGIDPARIAIMGDSGGGGIAAAAAIMARDEGIALARQILIYPMLDDRNTVPDPALDPTASWTYDNNRTCWDAVLGAARGADGVPPELAPARITDFAGLPPAYIDVGELDIFRDESLAYARGLAAAGVSCELHVHPGAPHGFDVMSLRFALSQRAMADRIRVIRSV